MLRKVLEPSLLNNVSEPRGAARGKNAAHFLYVALNVCLDWFSCFAPQALALFFLMRGEDWRDYPGQHPYLNVLAMSLCAVAILFASGVYRDEKSFLNVEDSKKIIKGYFLGFLLLLLAGEFLELGPVFTAYLISCTFSFMFIFYGKLLLDHKLQFLRDIFGSRVLIYGAGTHGRELFNLMANSPKLGLAPVGFIDDNPELLHQTLSSCGLQRCETVKVLGNGRDIARLASEFKADELILAMTHPGEGCMRAAFEAAARAGLKLGFVPYLYGLPQHKIHVSQIGGVPLAQFKYAATSGYLPAKRILDRLLAAAGLLLLSPLFLAVSLAVKLSSPGPVIFTHDRVGQNGRIFKMCKFRSMRVESDPYAVNPHVSTDPRITPLGRILRKTSLDELPQLLNVLRGEMSMVGPRPEMLFIAEHYDEIQKQRLKVPPGITGLWQISVDRKKAIHENMDYDLYYIRNMSLLLDLTIILETFAFVFKGI